MRANRLRRRGLPGRQILDLRLGIDATPAVLAYLSVLPLALAVLAVLFDGSLSMGRETAVKVLTGYGAVLLSFLGGIRWGMAMRIQVRQREALLLSASIVPPLIGWIATLTPPTVALGLLAAAFAGQGAWDVWTVEAGGAPNWYGGLRLRVTCAVTAILVVATLRLGA